MRRKVGDSEIRFNLVTHGFTRSSLAQPLVAGDILIVNPNHSFTFQMATLNLVLSHG